MMDGGTMPSNMSVEELKTIEEQMATVRQKIREAELSESTEKSGRVEAGSLKLMTNLSL